MPNQSLEGLSFPPTRFHRHTHAQALLSRPCRDITHRSLLTFLVSAQRDQTVIDHARRARVLYCRPATATGATRIYGTDEFHFRVSRFMVSNKLTGANWRLAFSLRFSLRVRASVSLHHFTYRHLTPPVAQFGR